MILQNFPQEEANTRQDMTYMQTCLGFILGYLAVAFVLGGELPQGTFAAIFPRSGIATKRGLRPANCVGVCDSDYRGEYIVALHNDTNEVQIIEPQERIAQMILLPFVEMSFNEVNELSDTVRGTGGFGGSGRF